MKMDRHISDEMDGIALKEEVDFLSLLLKKEDESGILNDALTCGIQDGQGNVPSHFGSNQCRLLYCAIKGYYLKHGAPLTYNALVSIIDRDELRSLIGGDLREEDKAALKSFFSEVVAAGKNVDARDYSMLKNNLNDRYYQWRLKEISRSKIKGLLEAKNDQAHIVSQIVYDIANIPSIIGDSYSRTVKIQEGMDRVMQHIIDMRENPDNNIGFMTGITGIDDAFHGFPPGSYTVISGTANGGKTTLMMNISFNMAKMGRSVLYISMEKTADLFYRRLLSCHAKVDYNRMKIGGKGERGLNDHFFQKLQEAREDLKVNKPDLTCCQFAPDTTAVSTILTKVEMLRKQRKIDVLAVDYLQVIASDIRREGRPDLELASVHKAIMAYGRVHGIAVFTASQLKAAAATKLRDHMKKAAKDNDNSAIDVSTEDFGGTISITQDADNALTIGLPQPPEPQTYANINITKSRDGISRKNIKVAFDGRTCFIGDLEGGQGQVDSVDSLLYSDGGVNEDDIMDDSTLFSIGESNGDSKDLSLDVDEDPFGPAENPAPVKSEEQPEPSVQTEESKPETSAEKPDDYFSEIF